MSPSRRTGRDFTATAVNSSTHSSGARSVEVMLQQLKNHLNEDPMEGKSGASTHGKSLSIQLLACM